MDLDLVHSTSVATPDTVDSTSVAAPDTVDSTSAAAPGTVDSTSVAAPDTFDSTSAAPPNTVDSAISVEKAEAGTLKREIDDMVHDEPAAKKPRLEQQHGSSATGNESEDRSSPTASARTWKKGVAPVKAEFVVNYMDDDAAVDGRDGGGGGGGKRKKKERGQNKNRKFTFEHDTIQLCPHLGLSPATDKPLPCARVGSGNAGAEDHEDADGKGGKGGKGVKGGKGGVNGCKFEHDIKIYVAKGKKPDLEGLCPVWKVRGECPTAGWRCRWLGSHMRVLEHGEMELVVDEEQKRRYREALKAKGTGDEPKAVEEGTPEMVNEVDMKYKIIMRKSKFEYPKSEPYLDWLKDSSDATEAAAENNASYVESCFRPCEKRPLDVSPDKPILAPLTTTGNLPFRRLCKSLGAAITYSEMAMSVPLLQGHKSEWTLLRAHTAEIPNFGAQICANKPWQAIKATEALTTLLPSRSLALVDLNCGCPIDMVYRSGGGSALLDQHGKLFKMLRGMNLVSGDTPITCKIRMGCKDAQPTAKKLLVKLWNAGDVSAVTLHGRSRQQRYTREADWGYISDCATMINALKQHSDDTLDTAAWGEGHDMPQTTSSSTSTRAQPMHIIGNGDIYSHHDYTTHLTHAPFSSLMIARGALIKPWIFEEITSRQYLDKSSTQRLDYIRDFVRFGLETWGADEFGIGTTRRFLLEWLSFSCRYVPIGILERLPPKIQDRPPRWKGRDEVETWLGSGDSRDWMRIAEMFLGKTPDGWEFVPKHKSNAYDGEAEG